MTAAQLIKDGFGTPTKPLTSCPNVDEYPPSPLGASVVYTGYEDPNEQDLKMLSYVEPGLQGGNPNAAFATMNWSEALYYGLQLASLQNGGGAFVTPSATTLDAAVNDATTNTDGTLDLNYSSADPNVYPMTSVIYAAVCGDAETTQTATNISNMLTQLLDVTGSSTTATLPEGFVPLTTGLTETAESEITKDVLGGASADADQSGCPMTASTAASPPAPSGTVSKSPTPSTASSPTSGVVPTVSGNGGSGSGSRSEPNPSSGSSPQGSSGNAFSGLSNGGAPGSPRSGAGAAAGGYLQSLTVASSSSRVFLPLALLLGLLAIVMGVFDGLFAIPSGASHRSGQGIETPDQLGLGKVSTRLSSWVSSALGGER